MCLTQSDHLLRPLFRFISLCRIPARQHQAVHNVATSYLLDTATCYLNRPDLLL